MASRSRQATKSTVAPKCNCSSGSAIIFLQRKQTEILSDLHQQIATLKRDNSDLKFQLFLKSENKKDERIQDTQLQNNVEELKSKVSDLTEKLQEEHSQIKSFERKLASVTDMLEESNFLKIQVETQCRTQKLEIKTLQKELTNHKATDYNNIFPTSAKKCHTSRTSYEDIKLKLKEDCELRRRSFSTSSNSSTPRRRSLSILPVNYKDSVSTLPPIEQQLKSELTNSTSIIGNASNSKKSFLVNLNSGNGPIKSSLTHSQPIPATGQIFGSQEFKNIFS